MFAAHPVLVNLGPFPKCTTAQKAKLQRGSAGRLGCACTVAGAFQGECRELGPTGPSRSPWPRAAFPGCALGVGGRALDAGQPETGGEIQRRDAKQSLGVTKAGPQWPCWCWSLGCLGPSRWGGGVLQETRGFGENTPGVSVSFSGPWTPVLGLTPGLTGTHRQGHPIRRCPYSQQGGKP